MTSEYELMRQRTISAIRSVYQRHGAGCCLHAVTDDGNTEDSSALYVLGLALDKGHDDCMLAAQGLADMRRTARKKAIAQALARDASGSVAGTASSAGST